MITTRKFERVTCPRCGGSGHYSFCTMYGTTCFSCNGAGKRLTKRGRVAYDFFTTSASKPVEDFKPGEFIQHNSGSRKFWKVESVTREPGSDRVEICYSNVVQGEVAGHMRRRGLTPEEKTRLLNAAFDYQDTLTKAGKPRKRKQAGKPQPMKEAL